MFQNHPPMDNAVNVGSTDYIDVVHERDITHNGQRVVCGSYVDQHGRSGVAFRARVFNTASNREVDAGVFAIFQRYTNGSLYVLCRSHTMPHPSHDDYCGLFNVIMQATSALTAYSLGVWSDMETCMAQSIPYITKDGRYRVEFVTRF